MPMRGDGAGGRGASVRLERLWKAYGDVVAVRDVSLSIGPGEFVTLLGPSGSGKTTTLMTIAGFVAPTRGEIYIDDRPIAGVPPQKRDLGVVFQNYALFPHMTVADNVAFPLQMRRLRREEVARRVAAALETVRLPGYEARFPRQLSGGQQQRVALARAVVFEPRVLLMDEPLGALDRKLREQLQLEIKHVQRRLGITVLYVTHDQGEALTMSDRIAVMRDGRVVQFGAPDALYEEPVDAFVADFVGESNFLRGVVVGSGDDGVVEVRGEDGQAFRAVARPAPALGAAALASVRPERLAVQRAAERAADGGAAQDGAADHGLNRWRGRVEEIIYAGDATKYKIAAAETVLTAKTQNRGPDRAARPGDLVDVVWDPRHTRLLSEGAAPAPAAPGSTGPVPAALGDR